MQKISLRSVKNVYKNRSEIIKNLRLCALTIIKEKPSVLKVILFGSIARGDYGLYSDADVLIIVNKSEYKRYFDRIPEFIDFFLNSKVPVDIFPYTAEEIERMKSNGNFFIIKALKEGIELAG